MVFAHQIATAEKLLAAFNEHTPRDYRGELTSPYYQWAKQLEEGIEKAKQWENNVKTAGK